MVDQIAEPQDRVDIPYPSTPRAAYGVGMLTIAYVLSFFDRQILGILVDPIKAHLDISDFAMGLLIGPAFALFYATLGIPIGWLADRANRRNIVATGILLWSMATASCGLAANFVQLFMARLSVGIGEAALGPCAVPMISDMVPKARRARAIGIYTAALPIGLGAVYLIAAQLLEWIDGRSFDLPIIGAVEGWQIIFLILGLPGIIVGLLFLFTVKEPARRTPPTSAQANNSLADSVGYFLKHWKLFGSFLAAPCLMTIIAYSHQWNVPLFTRTWGVSVPAYLFYTGMVFLFITPFFNMGSGWLTDRYTLKGIQDAAFRVYILGTLILVPSAAIFPLMPEPISAFILAQVCTIGIAMISATAPTALMSIVPGHLRAQGMALFYLAISLTGNMLGPSSVGFFNDYVFKDEAMIRYSMAIPPAILGIPLLLSLPAIRRTYLAALRADG